MYNIHIDPFPQVHNKARHSEVRKVRRLIENEEKFNIANAAREDYEADQCHFPEPHPEPPHTFYDPEGYF